MKSILIENGVSLTQQISKALPGAVRLRTSDCLDVLNHPRIHCLLKAVVIGVHVELVTCILPGLIIARSFASCVRRSRSGFQHALGDGLVGSGQEDDLAVGSLGHSLHGLEVSDLHGRSRAEDVGGLSHKLGGLDLGAGSDDLGFTNPLGLSGHGKRVLEIVAEDDVFDEHGLNLHTPAHGDVFDDFTNGLSDLLTALDDILENACTDDVTESGLGTLNESLTDVGDAKSGLVRRGDMVVNDGRKVEGNVVFCHADLARHLDDLDLDIDLDEALGERIDVYETGVDGASEFAELGDEADITLRNRFVWVGTHNAARNGAAEANAGPEAVD
jgi:hypothetical protein